MSTYPLVPLAGVATVRSGYAFKSSDWTESGVPVLKIANIHPGLVDLAGCGFVDEATAAKAQSFTVERDDSLIAMSGASVGKVGRVRFSERALVNQRVGRFSVLDPAKLDADFLYYSLQLPATVDYLTGSAYGSAQPNISPSLILNAEIPLPSLSEQKSITDLLCSLDDKIAANDKVALTLSEIAAAKYSSTSSNSDHVVPLKEIVTTQYGVTTKASEEPGPYLIRVTDINKKPWVEWETTPFCSVESKEWEKYKVSAGDILVARMADPGKAAYIDVEHPDAVFASYLVRLRPFEPSQALYIYYFLCSPEYRAYSAGAMQGSVQKNMNAKVIVDTQIALPGEESLTEFNAFVSPIRSQIQQMLSENATLKAVRDTLLPLLMSGKLRVQDAETALEGVL